MGKITTKKLKSNSGEEEVKEKKNELQSYSSSESSYSSSDTSDEEFDSTRKRKKSDQKKKSKKPKKKNQCTLITETISTIEAKIGICPLCLPISDDENEQMIGCDRCNNWFHYKCVGITVEPKDEKWFCKRCMEFNNKKR